MDLFQPRMGKHPTEIFETRRGPPDGSTPDYLRLVHQYFDQHTTNVATVDDLTAYIRGQYSSEKDEICVSARLHHVILPKLATGVSSTTTREVIWLATGLTRLVRGQTSANCLTGQWRRSLISHGDDYVPIVWCVPAGEKERRNMGTHQRRVSRLWGQRIQTQRLGYGCSDKRTVCVSLFGSGPYAPRIYHLPLVRTEFRA